MTAVALFFDSQADRDAAFAAIGTLLRRTDHGVSGPSPDNLTAQWQIWATGVLDPARIDAAIAVPSTRAANGRLAATLVEAAR